MARLVSRRGPSWRCGGSVLRWHRTMRPTRRHIAQRARRDAEAELRDPAPQYPRHGKRVGWITFVLFGRKVRAELLSTGKHCRSYGVKIDGEIVGVLGADKAWGEVSKRMPRMASLRHYL